MVYFQRIFHLKALVMSVKAGVWNQASLDRGYWTSSFQLFGPGAKSTGQCCQTLGKRTAYFSSSDPDHGKNIYIYIYKYIYIYI